EPLRRATSLKENYPEAYQELGYSLYKLNRPQEAIAAYQQSIQLKSDSGSAYLGLGDVYYYQTKQYREALAAYRAGVKIKDDNPTALYNLARCANEFDEYGEAANAARHAVASESDYPHAYAEVGCAQ